LIETKNSQNKCAKNKTMIILSIPPLNSKLHCLVYSNIIFLQSANSYQPSQIFEGKQFERHGKNISQLIFTPVILDINYSIIVKISQKIVFHINVLATTM
jgi:hypothetical protein